MAADFSAETLQKSNTTFFIVIVIILPLKTWIFNEMDKLCPVRQTQHCTKQLLSLITYLLRFSQET